MIRSRAALALVVLAGCAKSGSTPSEPAPAPSLTAEEEADVGEVRAKSVEATIAGTKAPTPVLELIDGGDLDLAEVIGHKPVYLKFWATWCVPCREQMPHFESVQQRYGDRMAVVAVNVGLNETEDAVREFQREHGLTMPVGFDRDGSIAKAFHVEVTPQHIVIDARGTISYVGHQASDALEATLTAALSSDGAVPTSAPPTESGPPPGELALDLIGGGAFHLAEATERPTVLSFVATWCDWYLEDSRPAMSKACIAQQKRLDDLHAAMGSEARFIGIAQALWTDEDQVRGYQERYGIAFPLGLDRGARWFSHFGVREVPTTIVLDASGSEQLRLTGDPVDLEAQLKPLLAR